MHEQIVQAAEALAAADALLIGAGAGMGVDSGLPDFRGDQGFWKAYPPYQKLGLNFYALANPRWFHTDPGLAWGFYGHRLNLYRETTPHEGFQILRFWAERMRLGGFVYTSNVDGHFQLAGFDPERVLEVHGSIHWLQCMEEMCAEIFPADGCRIAIDPDSMRASQPWPECPKCAALARPNILMFNDYGWDGRRSEKQASRLREWLEAARGSRLVIVECGAGTAVPTVRHFCEGMALSSDATLIRINPREPEVPNGHISVPLGALAALRYIDENR